MRLDADTKAWTFHDGQRDPVETTLGDLIKEWSYRGGCLLPIFTDHDEAMAYARERARGMADKLRAAADEWEREVTP